MTDKAVVIGHLPGELRPGGWARSMAATWDQQILAAGSLAGTGGLC